MPDLSFQVESAEALAYAAAPMLVFKLRVNSADATPIQSVALRCQIRIEPTRRRYSETEQPRLSDLFGEPHRWGQTLRSMLWTHTTVTLPPFTQTTLVDMPVPCTFDFNVAATKYFAALDDGEVPLTLLFSGTVFHSGSDGGLQIAQISWEKEAVYRLPVQVWKDMMNHYYPNEAWLSLHKDVFDRLLEYKTRRGLATWEQTLESLLPPVDEEVAK